MPRKKVEAAPILDRQQIEAAEARKNIFELVNNSVISVKEEMKKVRLRKPEKDHLNWTLQAVEHAKARANPSEDAKLEVTGLDGSKQKEGIPVDELIDAMRFLATKLKKKDFSATTKLMEQADKLWENSEEYFKIRPEMKNDNQHWRTTLEAQYISSDYRATGSEEEDYQLAMETMSKRRELVIPKTKQEKETEKVKNATEAVKEEVKTTKQETKQTETEKKETFITPQNESKKKSKVEVLRENPPQPETAENLKPPSLKGVYIDISTIVERLAWTQAKEKLNQYLKGKEKKDNNPKKSWFNRAKESVVGAFKKVYVRMTDNYHLNKFYDESIKAIKENKNLMAQIRARLGGKESGVEGLTASDELNHFAALDSIVETYVQEVEEAEERGEKLNNPEVNARLSVLFYEFATGQIPTDRRSFDQLVADRILPVIKDSGKQFATDVSRADDSRDILYAHNFYQLAENYKGYIDQKVSELESKYGKENREAIMGHIKGLMAIDIQLGLKQRDVRDTKPKETLNWLDKLLDKAQNNRYLNKFITNPLTHGFIGGVLGTVGGKFALSGSIRAGLSATSELLASASPAIVGGLFGGVFTALRRGKELKYDRGLENQRAALGYDAGGERASKIREFQVPLLSADDVISRLESIAVSATALNVGNDNYIADIIARLTIEKDMPEDLIAAGVEEGTKIGVKINSINKIKLALRKIAQAQGLNNEGELAVRLQTTIESRVVELQNRIAANDSEFASYRRIEMAKAAAFGAVVGVAGGVLGQAAILGMRGEFSQSLMSKGGKSAYKAVDNLSDWMAGVSTVDTASAAAANAGASASLHEILLPGGRGKLFINDNLNIISKGLDRIDIVNPQGEIVASDLQLVNGQISAQSIDKLRALGWEGMQTVNVPDVDIGPAVQEMAVPGLNEVSIRLPAGMAIIEDSGSYAIVSDSDGSLIANGLNFKADGTLDAGSIDLLQKAGFNVGHQDGGLFTSGNTLARDYLRDNYGNGSDGSTRRIWHGNKDLRLRQAGFTDLHTSLANKELEPHVADIPQKHYPYDVPTSAEEPRIGQEHIRGTVFDWRELKLYLQHRQNGDAVLSAKECIRDMIKLGGSRGDGIVDEKWWAMKNFFKANGKDMSALSDRFSFRFYLTKQDFDAGQAITIGVDAKGELVMPKGSELHELLMNGKKLAYTTEMSYDDPIKNIHHIISTKPVGFPELEVPRWVSALDGPKIPGESIQVLTPPEAPPPGAVDWLIPTPFAPRKALESPTVLRPIFPYYYEAGFHGDQDRYKKIRSRRLKENPAAKLDEQDILEYLTSNKDKYEEIKQFDIQIGEPMKDECKLAVCIPCASFKEKDNIYKTLEKYADQKNGKNGKLNRDLFEVIVFLNKPKGAVDDGSTAEVDRFKKDYPDMNVRVMAQDTDWGQHTSWGEKVGVESLTRRIYDTAAYRATNKKRDKDVIILMADSDLEGMSPKLLSNYIKEFDDDKDKKVDAIGGDVDWGNAIDELPTVFAATRLWQSLDKQLYTHKNLANRSIPSWGANFAMRASSYAGIGGRGDWALSDVDLARQFLAARQPIERNLGEKDYPLKYIYDQWLDSSPRRLLLARVQDIDPIMLYAAKETPATDKLGLDELVTMCKAKEISKNKVNVAELQKMVNNFIRIYQLDLGWNSYQDFENNKRKHNDRALILRAFIHLGISISIEKNGTIVILDVKEFEKKLKDHQEGKNFFDSLPDGEQGKHR